MRAHFLANLRAASLASVPELAKNTLSAKEVSTNRLASFTCSQYSCHNLLFRWRFYTCHALLGSNEYLHNNRQALHNLDPPEREFDSSRQSFTSQTVIHQERLTLPVALYETSCLCASRFLPAQWLHQAIGYHCALHTGDRHVRPFYHIPECLLASTSWSGQETFYCIQRWQPPKSRKLVDCFLVLLYARCLTKSIDCYSSCKIKVFVSMCIIHASPISMSEHNLWSYICLHHISA